MKPDVATFLDNLVPMMMGDLATRLPSPYDAATLATSAILLAVVREEWDRAAARRVEENRALRALFRDAVGAVGATDLAARLSAAAAADEPSFRIGDLDRANDTLRALLIELHAHVETLATAGARKVEEAIWRELAASTERRRLMLAPF